MLRQPAKLVFPMTLSLLVLLCVAACPCQAQNFALQQFTKRYCVDCHNPDDAQGGLDLDSVLNEQVASHTDTWERVLRKLKTCQMPPRTAERPTESEYSLTAQRLTHQLDTASIKSPTPGTSPSLKRLNRTEYQNAVRDLLALDIDATELLPPDESSAGFDHTLVQTLSPVLVTRYLNAARKVAKLAIGSSVEGPDGKTYRIRPDVTQEKHVHGLPLGTRGGGTFLHHFPQAGIYEVQIRLTRDRNDEVEGLKQQHELLVLVDSKQSASLTIQRPSTGTLADFDDRSLRTRFQVPAGPHQLGATFLRKSGSLEETIRKPLNVHYNLHRHPRLNPAIYEVSITGPYPDKDSLRHPGQTQPAENQATPSQKQIFIARPNDQVSPEIAATRVLAQIARRAYRRKVTPHDMTRLLSFFHDANSTAGFDAGIESALAAVLTSPHFLLKMEATPNTALPGSLHAINDFELASRLSFFLWSSLPDDALLDSAERAELHHPDILRSHVDRMLDDVRSRNLATNFGGQWLQLRNLASITPDARAFPDFDENLRRAMRRETELHIESMITEDRSVLDLLRCEHTFLNERLAKHYEIPGIHGSRFRSVKLDRESRRGGLLRQASILTVTSYATRTSPVVRGNWVLENIIGSPAPPPPNDVPGLEAQSTASESAPIRERLLQHRKDAACARCHDLMDPIGFALENYDAVGRWRERVSDKPILTHGQLPNGQQFDGIEELENVLLAHPELFVEAFTEKLLSFALGRGSALHDGPTLRKIVRDAAAQHYRLREIVLGIVRSVPFQFRIKK